MHKQNLVRNEQEPLPMVPTSFLTRDIEVRIAGSFAHFVGNNTFINSSMGMTDRAEDQTVYILICKEERKTER